MNKNEETALNTILDKIIHFAKHAGTTSMENSLKVAQVVRDLSVAYLNIIQASDNKGGAE